MIYNPKATHLLIRNQEIALKGKNRPEFERRLKTNIARYIAQFPEAKSTVDSMSGRFVVEITPGSPNVGKIIDRLATLGGIFAVTPCQVVAPTPEIIAAEAFEWAKFDIAANPQAKTFAIRTRRVDKKFPMRSKAMDIAIGTQIKEMRDDMNVDLKRADVKVKIEVRHRHALIYSQEKLGIGGLPMDATQRVVCLLSGGIDSPVAAHEVIRRGVTPVFVHFHSQPFTSEASIDKVKRLAGILRTHSPYPLELWLVPLLDIQKAVRDNCNDRLRTIHYRRFMMMIAQELATRRGARALVTGEALGQVASQTLTNMQVIDDVVTYPVLRPLITLDKNDIIQKAITLGTYKTSIEPHDDSCILFAPTNPATNANLMALRGQEELLPSYELIFSALDRAKKILL